jgi:hypothetical protein
LKSSVADPDPRSGTFLTPASGIRIRGGKKSRARIIIPDLIYEDLVSVFWLKYSNSLIKVRNRGLVKSGSGIRDGKA